MRWSRGRTVETAGTRGAARLDRSTARLLTRLEPGDIAVLDHLDLDAASADALVACGVAAVVNASPSTSGRYPNLGPRVLVGAGIPLLDAVGGDVFDAVREGREVRLEGDTLWSGERPVASGALLDADSVAAAAEHARSGLAAQLADLATNATGLLLAERNMLLEGVGIPHVATQLEGRPVLVVAGGQTAAQELALLRRFRREHCPIVIGVDGGADLLLAHRIVPDLVVGDTTVMSDRVLTAARDVVGVDVASGRLQELGVIVTPFVTSTAHEDMALLLADHGGASVIVAVGFPATLEQLLDRGRSGASSALLVRAGLGHKVVGATAAAQLSASRIPLAAVLLLLLAAAVALVVAFAFIGGHGFDPALLDERWQRVLDRVLELLPW